MKERANEYYWILTWAMVCLATLYCLGLRAYLAFDLPLWLDESWTAVLSAAPTFRSFTFQMWLDSNAPLYYFIIWLWPFETNFGLRMPSILFLIVAGVVAVCWRPKDVSREQALLWASLLVTWGPGIVLFLDARYYALLFLISTVQAICYLKLLENPTLARACGWVGLSTLAILTHYYAALPALIQGLFYLARYRSVAVRTWPALALTLPAIGWGIHHLPRLMLYAQPGISWYARQPLSEVPSLLLMPIGASVLTAVVTLALVLAFWKRPPSNIIILVAAAVTSALALVLIGLLTPSLVGRYLLPVVPSMLLGLALSIQRVGYLPLVVWFLLNVGGVRQWKVGLSERATYGLELPAQYLPDADAITWAMDGGGSIIFDRRQMESMLADALIRNGRKVEAHWGHDISASTALIWFTKNNPQQAVVALGADWRCRDISKGFHQTIICWRGPILPVPGASGRIDKAGT